MLLEKSILNQFFSKRSFNYESTLTKLAKCDPKATVGSQKLILAFEKSCQIGPQVDTCGNLLYTNYSSSKNLLGQNFIPITRQES